MKIYSQLSLLFLSLILLSLSSCSPDYVLEKELEVNRDAWLYRDSLSFPFEIKDTVQRYKILMEMDHSPDFQWQNLYVNIGTRFPSGKYIQQAVSLEMADPSGIWNGDCSNQNCKLLIDLQEKVRFDEKGDYIITLAQFSRTDSLKGIHRISLKIEGLE